MGSTNVDPRDLVLAIVAFNKEGTVEGRTYLQKLAYFLNEKLELGVEFEPHYYGPYSDPIAMATNTMVALGFLDEKDERFPAGPTDIFEPRRYTYQLTPAGHTILAELKSWDRTLFANIKEAMEAITAKEECNYEFLSRAAKMFHLLKSQDKPMKGSELSGAAKDLGWKLSKEDIDRAAQFLGELRLIKELT